MGLILSPPWGRWMGWLMFIQWSEKQQGQELDLIMVFTLQ